MMKYCIRNKVDNVMNGRKTYDSNNGIQSPTQTGCKIMEDIWLAVEKE